VGAQSGETMQPRLLHAHKTFPADERSVGEARRYARETLAGWDVGDVVDDAVLLVSELVTNALTHAGTAATLELQLADGGVRVVVEDLHPGRGLQLATGAPSGDAEFGRGLLITGMLSSFWGVEYRPGSKRVWAFLPVPDQPGVLPGGQVTGGSGTEETSAPEPDAGSGPTVNGSGHPRPAGEAPAADPLGLGSRLLGRLGLDDLVALVVERVRDRLAADAAYLLLADEVEEDFRVRAVSGLPATLRGRAVGRLEAGAPKGWSPVSLPDLGRTEVPILADTGLRSVVVVPVSYDGRVIGGLGVASDRVDDFSEQESVLLQRSADWVAGAVDRARHRVSEQTRRGWLSYLAEASILLAGSLDPDMTIAMTGQLVVPDLAGWCGIYLNDERGRPVLMQAWHEDEAQTAALRDTLASFAPAEAQATGEPMLGGTVLSIPLQARARTIGWLTLGRAEGDPLRGEVLLVAEAVARRAALAIDNAQAHADLQAAGEALQRSLLPASVPTMPGVQVGVVYEPAAAGDRAGGDFYDLFPAVGGRWCFVVGDVCGKGAEAAAVTGMARHTIRALMRAGFPLASTLERLNLAILEEEDRSRFVTLVCGTLEPVPGGGTLMRLVCAGHPPPFVVGRDGRAVQFGQPQPLLGVIETAEYTAEERVLERGDLLVAVTDGVLERRSGSRMLGDDGVAAELEAARTLPAQAVADRLRRAVVEFAADPHRDDLAILVLRMGTGPPSR